MRDGNMFLTQKGQRKPSRGDTTRASGEGKIGGNRKRKILRVLPQVATALLLLPHVHTQCVKLRQNIQAVAVEAAVVVTLLVTLLATREATDERNGVTKETTTKMVREAQKMGQTAARQDVAYKPSGSVSGRRKNSSRR
jgi:hypothetical protein